MAYEINITGEIIPFEGWNGYFSSTDLDKLLQNANGEDLIVNINSVGGDVDEGFMIYVALRKYAEKNKAKITTYAKGRCYSIATVIFLAGDTRIANRYLSPFIHNAWAYTMGDANQLIKDAADLERTNKQIGVFYAEHTDLTYDEARAWMDADTFIDPDECVRIRFATEVEEIVRPAALMRTISKEVQIQKNNNKNSNMKKKPLDKGFFNKLKHILNAVEENSVELNTATNSPIVFPDLDEGEEPSVGDSGEMDGKPAEGEILMQDGRTFVFEAGVITEIREKDGNGDEQTVEELRAENAALREELEAQNAVIETQGNEIQDIQKTLKALNSKFNKFGSLLSSYSTEDDGKENPNRTKTSKANDTNDDDDDAPLETKNLKENFKKYKSGQK